MRADMLKRQFRKEAERQMQDTCRISRPTGETTTDPDTFEVVPVLETVYEGRCKFQTTGQGRTPNEESGGYQFTVLQNSCHLPFGTVTRADDVITCVTSENPALVGLVFRVTGYAVDSYATAARVPVERHES